MTSLPDSARAVLESPALAHLVTLNPDGSPQVSVVWVGLDGDEIVAGHLPEHRKVRNIRNDSRVAASLEKRYLPTRQKRRCNCAGHLPNTSPRKRGH
jgi:PPOX class probable F420-dependent enzyme